VHNERKSSVLAAAGLAILGFALGAMGLSGWIFDWDWATRVLPGLSTMKPNTAIAILLGATGILLQARGFGRGRAGLPDISRVVGAVVALLGAATLLEEFASIDLGIDELLFRDDASRLAGLAPGRMAQGTAMCALLLGVSLVLQVRSDWTRRVVGVLTALTGLIALVALATYIYGVADLYSIAFYKTLALHTALAFALLAVSLMLLNHGKELNAAASGDGGAAILCRRYVPVAVFAPLLLGGYIVRSDELLSHGPAFAAALVATLSGVLGLVLAFRAILLVGRAEQKLRESEESLRATLHSAGDAMIATDREGRVTRLNPVAASLTGWSEAEARGRDANEVFRLVDEVTRRPLSSPIDKVLRTAVTASLPNSALFVARDGREVPIADSCAAIRGADGASAGVILMFRDTSRERAAERAIRAERERFRLLLEATPDAMLISDAAGEIRGSNTQAEATFGYAHGELVGMRVEALLPQNPSLEAATGARQDSSRWAGREFVAVTRSGDEFPADLSLSTAEFDGARWVLTSVRDVTARRRLEEQLRHAQRMDAIGRLAGGVAHDFNNLITVIMSFSTFAKQDLLVSAARASEDLDQVIEAAQRASGLTAQLLAFSRRQVIDPKPLDLNQLVESMDRMLRRVLGEDVELVSQSAPEALVVRTDATSFEQILVNLATNARDAMPTGGRLSIELSRVELDREYAEEHPEVVPGTYAKLDVSDSGLGMPPEICSRIFEPFFTTKEQGKGIGLGLAMCYGIVHQLGGHIWVYSEVGHGTTFKIYFPCEESMALPVSDAPLDEIPGGAETVLLVEDEPAVRALATRTLRERGYEVLVAETGEIALELCRRHAGAIHLLLTDVVMPAMSGRQVVDKVAELRPGTRVLFMSGWTDNAVVRHGVLQPGTQFLQKPFMPGELLRKVRVVLDAG
jgi:two-component system cell cycle sensor histidine kinase/response regulator CckA